MDSLQKQCLITQKCIEFNCNSFTDDCVGFLTGRSIPSYIKGWSLVWSYGNLLTTIQTSRPTFYPHHLVQHYALRSMPCTDALKLHLPPRLPASLPTLSLLPRFCRPSHLRPRQMGMPHRVPEPQIHLQHLSISSQTQPRLVGS